MKKHQCKWFLLKDKQKETNSYNNIKIVSHDALPNYEMALQSLRDNSSSRLMYGYLMSDEEWYEHFVGFLAGKKTLPLLYDPFFKIIFNPIEERARLSELVSCILGQHVTVIEVFPNANSAFLNSFVIMDMVVRLDDGSITNIEIQKVPYDFPAARITCYSADLVLRQFRMLQGMTKKNENDEYMEKLSKKRSYANMKKVHTIIFFEKSSKSLKSHIDKRLYFHVGRIKFNTNIKMKLLQEYHLISLDTFKKYRYSDIIEGRIDSVDFDCDDSQYEIGLTEKMRADRLKYLSLFCAETPDEINRLVSLFPDLYAIRQKINEYLTRPEEVLNMFSEALRILDNNTAELMADRYKAELEVANKKAERWKAEAEKRSTEAEERKVQAEQGRAQAEARIKELEDQLKELELQYEKLKK